MIKWFYVRMECLLLLYSSTGMVDNILYFLLQTTLYQKCDFYLSQAAPQFEKWEAQRLSVSNKHFLMAQPLHVVPLRAESPMSMVTKLTVAIVPSITMMMQPRFTTSCSNSATLSRPVCQISPVSQFDHHNG